MSKIDDKWQQLKKDGLDLGAPVGPEEAAAAGGRVRRYQNGHIYWCSATGAREVHGGILSLYLAHGGPGANPATGERELGYPTTDELQESTPRSLFEWGAIYWTQGTGGCVLSGAIWSIYKDSELGLPLTGNLPLAGGTAAFFERGVLFSSNGAPGVTRVLTGRLQPPLMGRPQLLDPGDSESRRFRALCVWKELLKSEYNALVAWRPAVFTEIWNGRLSVAPVGNPNYRVPLSTIQVHTSSDAAPFMNMETVLEILPNGPTDVADRTLYDLRLALPNGTHFAVSPHCLYAKRNWDDFGLLHVTDLHISKRNEDFRQRLNGLGLTDAAQKYANFQDNFRDFVKYANHLHSIGLADAVIATGDLVDYVEEEGDGLTTGNFVRLRRLLLGEPMGEGSPAGEELRLPVYMTFGNHDYRIAPYDLRYSVDLPGSGHDKGLNEHSAHNLMESDAVALQGGKTRRYGVSDANDALRMAQWDRFDNKYGYFKKYFTAERSYVVKLGKHRLVVLDTKYDAGVPQEANLDFFLKQTVGIDWLTGSPSAATSKFLSGGSPDSEGFTAQEITLLSNTVRETAPDGLIIVGTHTPPLSPKGNEYPYYLRETVHPTADPALTAEYIERHELNGQSWSRTGTAHFKAGDNTDGMDQGVIAERATEFLQVCAGVNLPRPVDLVLSGHHHDRVEYRLRWNGQLEFYMDFYTETPRSYYHTVNGFNGQDLRRGAPIQIAVVPNAPLPVGIMVVRDHRQDTDGAPAIELGTARVPPYSNPLESATDARQWWQFHRPILAQTGALGPIDPRQRFGTFWKLTPPPEPYRPTFESDTGPHTERGVSAQALPARLVEPTFQGFRLIAVKGNVIAHVRYVVLKELRERSFRMPWEPPIVWHVDPDVVFHV